MANLYEVTVLKNRRVHGPHGYFTHETPFVVHHCYQVAPTSKEARDLVQDYYIPPGTEYDEIRVTYIRED